MFLNSSVPRKPVYSDQTYFLCERQACETNFGFVLAPKEAQLLSQTCQVSGSLDDACLLSLLTVLVSWSRARQVMPRPAGMPNHCQPKRRPWLLSLPPPEAGCGFLSPLVQGTVTILDVVKSKGRSG